jgi:dTDP-D-glucose 4,6-dehydratase
MIIKIIKNIEDIEDWVEYEEDRPFNDQRYHISSDKLRTIGWKPKKNIKDLINFITTHGGVCRTSSS